MAISLVNISVTFALYLGLICDVVRCQDNLVPEECVYTGTHLDCSRRKLQNVPKYFPPDVVKIDLSWNRLRVVNASVFANLTHLRIVKFGHNHLRSIPRLKSANLTDLILDHNDINAIDTNLFVNLPNLRFLDLNSNRISNLRVFPNTTALRILYLNNNRISSIPAGSLDNLSQLEVLRLNRNRLKSINKDVFDRLTKLQTLELMRNDINHVEALSFKFLANLRVLKLRKNRISQLADGAFWGLQSIQVLKLDYNNISSVGEGWLYGLESLESLTLSHNSITRVKSIGWKFCKLLRQLDLRHNELTEVRTENFSQLDKLQTLNLDHNKLQVIQISAFDGLDSLESLQINHNQVQWNVEDMNGVFSGLRSLTRLGLTDNRISVISANAFSHLTRLRSLHLSQNQIASVQRNAFQNMPALTELRLNSSSLMCDCNLAWLPLWLKDSQFEDQIHGVCAHPTWLKGHNMLVVQQDQFKCDDVPKPIIISSPQSHVAVRGSDTRLDCTVASSSNSPMQFQWRKNGEPIKDADVENFAQTDSTMLMNSTTILHLNAVTDNDEGSYQCVVTNEFGSTYSQKARITVHVLPTFTKRPSNVTVKAGNTARLECSATGHPTPQIVWQKDGGDDFPAAHERRMHVMPTDVVFFIVKVKAADSGIYSCIATSAAGRIVANATVAVLETPSFVKGMVDKSVRARETAVLECLSAGSPKPHLVWLKDDKPLKITPRHFFTADNQLLIIVQTTYSDAGRYTCEMTNTLGTDSDSSQLEILAPAGSPQFMSSLSDQSTMIGIIIIAVVCCVVGTSLVWVIIIYQTRKKTEEAYTPTPTDEMTIPTDLPSSAAELYPSLEKDRSSRLSLHLPDSMSPLTQHPIYSLSAMNLSQPLGRDTSDDSQQPFLRCSWLERPLAAAPTTVVAPPSPCESAPPTVVALVHHHADLADDDDCGGGHYRDLSHQGYQTGQMTSPYHGCQCNNTINDSATDKYTHLPPSYHELEDSGGGGFCEECAMLRDRLPGRDDTTSTRQSTLRRHSHQPINDLSHEQLTNHRPDNDHDDDDVTTPLRTFTHDDVIAPHDAEFSVEMDVGDGGDVVCVGNNNCVDSKPAQNGTLVLRTFENPASHRTIV